MTQFRIPGECSALALGCGAAYPGLVQIGFGCTDVDDGTRGRLNAAPLGANCAQIRSAIQRWCLYTKDAQITDPLIA